MLHLDIPSFNHSVAGKLDGCLDPSVSILERCLGRGGGACAVSRIAVLTAATLPAMPARLWASGADRQVPQVPGQSSSSRRFERSRGIHLYQGAAPLPRCRVGCGLASITCRGHARQQTVTYRFMILLVMFPGTLVLFIAIDAKCACAMLEQAHCFLFRACPHEWQRTAIRWHGQPTARHGPKSRRPSGMER